MWFPQPVQERKRLMLIKNLWAALVASLLCNTWQGGGSGGVGEGGGSIAEKGDAVCNAKNRKEWQKQRRTGRKCTEKRDGSRWEWGAAGSITEGDVTSCWYYKTEKLISSLIPPPPPFITVCSSELPRAPRWDSAHADCRLLILFPHIPLRSPHRPLFLQLSGSAASPSPVYGTVRLLAETKNAPRCVNKPSFKEIELYRDKRCPWAWVQITDWSDTADSLCFVN